MPNNPTLHRLGLILRWVKEDSAISYEDILRKYQKEMEPLLLDGVAHSDSFTLRTFQRDVADLKKYFSIEIEYDRKAKGYRRVGPLSNGKYLNYMLDTLDMYKLMQMKPVTEPVLFPDERRANGSEHMYLLLHAITNQLKLEFTYEKFDGDPPFQTKTNPLALKEFRNRWYLLAFADGKPTVKSWCLDRMTDLKLTDRKFNPAEAENWRSKFACVFGITSGNPDEVEDILLSFSPQQGRYAKALKLHPTQEVIFENGNEIRMGLRICITHEFVMELLSYGGEVEVLQPAALRLALAGLHKEALGNYSQKTSPTSRQ